MAKLSANYEVLYIIDPTLGEEETAALVARFKELAEGHGTVTEVDEWGKRKLAYLINDKDEGFYVLMTDRHRRGIFFPGGGPGLPQPRQRRKGRRFY